MLITDAYAQVAGGVYNGSSFVSYVPFILILAIMYFFMIRPQRVQMKKRQEMLEAVRRGDTIITGGGIIGKVTKVYDDIGELEVEISDGIRIRIIRSTLSDVRVKGEPIAEKKQKNSKTQASQKLKTKSTVKEKVIVSKEKEAMSEESDTKV